MINETKFPYGEIADEYAKEFIIPWFKRCLDDFPSAEQYADAFYYNWDSYGWRLAVLKWKRTWFSQFIEKGEEQ